MKHYDIFISYRREGGYDTAKHLYDLLIRDGYTVSFDIDTLRSGDFDAQLLTRIDQCKDFLLIIDEHAFDRTINPNFNPKQDWLRCELSYALKKNKNIIPVFLSGAKGFPVNLPKDVMAVAKKNGPEYNQYHFNAFYDDLKKRFLTSRSHKLKWKYLFILLVACLAVYGLLRLGSGKGKIGENVTNIISNAANIEYYTKGGDDGLFDDELYAKVDGYEYKIDIPKDMCILVAAQEDFDGDGYVDALIEDVQACGGNAMGNAFFFVSYSGNGYFSISNSFGNNVWEDPVVEDWNGQKTVVIIDVNVGFNQDKDYNSKERYILKQGNAVRVESSKKNSIVALQEIRASDFHNGRENNTIRMSYDLDENGEEDVFECTYWDRWDNLCFKIILNGNTLDYSDYGVSRVGVLSSKTKGMHDLVCNENDIIKWNGKEYVFQ